MHSSFCAPVIYSDYRRVVRGEVLQIFDSAKVWDSANARRLALAFRGSVKVKNRRRRLNVAQKTVVKSS